ncbi:sugar kinase [Curvibacter sp. CHRR-16]|uniref:sugar kinase n=1 Tax=Curvibacter sp. CHRR-16 TaxID=2835872 RepID=UPI001BD97A54|nr:sugar kinase [Curvibacter sp. CHRR-16]MBT0569473.1 sugar kinase [Curvibacter sp. CHRR-16]
MHAAALDVLTLGEAMALFVAQDSGPLSQVEHFARTTAGAELNVAIGLRRLGFRVGYASRLGQDAFGDYLLERLQAEGINHQHVQRDAHYPTGFMLKSRQTDGSDPQVQYFRQGSAASRMGVPGQQEGLLDYCLSGRWLHITGISVALSDSLRELVFALVQEAKRRGVRVSFDPNLRPRLWPSQALMVDTLNALAAHCDLVLPGLAEGQLLTGQRESAAIAQWYLDNGASQVLIKLGPPGAYYASHDGHGTVPGFAVPRVVDTVGAGDGFAVGVLAGLLDGLPLPQAVRQGNAIGALVVQSPGDNDGLPDRAGLQRMLQTAA